MQITSSCNFISDIFLETTKIAVNWVIWGRYVFRCPFSFLSSDIFLSLQIWDLSEVIHLIKKITPAENAISEKKFFKI